jgi:hypothetical protein
MASASSLITGTVRDPKGRPVPQARVFFTGGPEPIPDIAALTNESGAFTLSAPGPGEYSIGFAVEGFAPVEVKAKAGRHDLEIKLRDK